MLKVQETNLSCQPEGRHKALTLRMGYGYELGLVWVRWMGQDVRQTSLIEVFPWIQHIHYKNLVPPLIRFLEHLRF